MDQPTITPGEHAPAQLPTGSPPPQVDYRRQPDGARRVTDPTPTASSQLYGDPIDDTAYSVAPPTDETFKAYDLATDAMRFNGINSPAQQYTYITAGDTPPPQAHEK